MTFKRTEFSSLKLVELLIAAVCLSGCDTVTFPTMEPQPIPDISKLNYDYFQPQLRLKLPDVQVDVTAMNRVSLSWPKSRHGDKLLVLVALSPKADGVWFDPSRVRYQPENEQPGRPSLVQGPPRKPRWKGGGSKLVRTCSASASSYKYPDTYALITGSVPVTKRTCFRVFFDYDRLRTFTLFIEGISKSGKPLHVPPVVFEYKMKTRRLFNTTYSPAPGAL